MSAEKWLHYGGVNDDLGGCWQGMTIGPMPTDRTEVPDLAGFPLLGSWDHQPTVQEVDAVTPWDFRTICPACGVEGCDDEAHCETLWRCQTGTCDCHGGAA